jgi:putative addiction module component (TIGR02574 family)
MTIADIISSAKQLPLAHQYQIAEALLESIEPMPQELQQAWLQESQQRMRAFDAGQMPTGSLDAVLTKYRA